MDKYLIQRNLKLITIRLKPFGQNTEKGPIFLADAIDIKLQYLKSNYFLPLIENSFFFDFQSFASIITCLKQKTTKITLF